MKRYILLRDNRIIDTEIYKINQEECFSTFICFSKKVDKNLTSSYIVRPSDIIKESDNLMVLIEVGDLIEYKVGCATYGGIVSAVWKGNFNISIQVLDGTIDINFIIKIYKPNNNKGYDLAWEREE